MMAPSSALVPVACCTNVTVAAFPGLKNDPLAVSVPVPTLIVAADSASVRGFGLTDGELTGDGGADGRGDGEAAAEGVVLATAGASTWSVCCSRHEPFQQSLSRWSPGSMSTGTTKDSSTRPLASARNGKVYRALQSSTRPAWFAGRWSAETATLSPPVTVVVDSENVTGRWVAAQPTTPAATSATITAAATSPTVRRRGLRCTRVGGGDGYARVKICGPAGASTRSSNAVSEAAVVVAVGTAITAVASTERAASGASAPSRASTNAPADSHLASGALASPRRITASTPGPREESRDLGVQDLHQPFAIEGDDAGQHLVRDRGQRVAVCRRPHAPARHLLRGHVGRRAGGHPGHRFQRRALHELGEPEIGENRGVLGGQEHVGRLHVAMHHASAVGVVEAGRDASQIPESAAAVDAAGLHLAGQAAAWHVLDDHVRRPLELAVVVDVDDVGMAQLRDRLRLVAEAGDRVRVGRHRLHHLDRAGALQVGVVGAEDASHRALADELLDLVLA